MARAKTRARRRLLVFFLHLYRIAAPGAMFDCNSITSEVTFSILRNKITLVVTVTNYVADKNEQFLFDGLFQQSAAALWGAIPLEVTTNVIRKDFYHKTLLFTLPVLITSADDHHSQKTKES